MILQKIKLFFLKAFGLVPNPVQVHAKKPDPVEITEIIGTPKNVRKVRKPRVAKPKKIAEITEK